MGCRHVSRSWLRVGLFALIGVLALGMGFGVGRFTSTRVGAKTDAADAGAVVELGGLAVSAGGYTLATEATTVTTGQATTLRFRILGPDGTPLLRYGVSGDRLMRLYALRRDLSGFTQLAPALSADGMWSAPLTLPEPGSWRLLADFIALDEAGHPTPVVLGVDLSVIGGGYTPHALVSPAATASADSYTVTLAGNLTVGHAEPIQFSIADGAQTIRLGAPAQLVAIRDGDLAYLRVPAEDGTRFRFGVPSPGRYRLFLDFTTAGSAHTAAFTVEAT